MRLGNKAIYLVSVYILILFNSTILAEDRIVTTPLINLDELTPSFEEVDNSSPDIIEGNAIKNKKKKLKTNKALSAKLIGLDKITAKTTDIEIKLGETKKFGPLEIKVLKCGKINLRDKLDNVAYLQVKDISENENEKVFIFNGWTFSSDPALAPFDHAIYDLQLVNCNNA